MRSATFFLYAAFLSDGIYVTSFSSEVGLSRCRQGRIDSSRCSPTRPHARGFIRPGLPMVRNVDLPEVLVFYGLESIFEAPLDEVQDTHQLKLRSGLLRLFLECSEVGTAALILSEFNGLNEDELKQYFTESWAVTYAESNDKLKSLACENDPVLSLRCIDTRFTPPESENNDEAEYLFYNLHSLGRSPSPAFLLDSLQSVHIDPRGFGGSSGFARGQWVEPRRSPMTARTVVFVAGDWKFEQTNDASSNIPWLSNQIDDYTTTVRDRCAAARAAGCRIIYIENLEPNDLVQDDESVMSKCDAVIETYGSDNPRDMQPISLDAVSTPGDYWLNPPCPRDDLGNAVVADEIVEWFRAEREMEDIFDDAECVVASDAIEDGDMSEDEMDRILADLDKL